MKFIPLIHCLIFEDVLFDGYRHIGELLSYSCERLFFGETISK